MMPLLMQDPEAEDSCGDGDRGGEEGALYWVYGRWKALRIQFGSGDINPYG